MTETKQPTNPFVTVGFILFGLFLLWLVLTDKATPDPTRPPSMPSGFDQFGPVD